MKLLIALYKYFPCGGLQKDTLRFAEEAVSRGHEVTIFTTSWEGEKPSGGIKLTFCSCTALSNHARMDIYSRKFCEYRYLHGFDVALAMNRIPGAEFYFVADSCMASWMPLKHSRLTLALLDRYRVYLRHEAEICAPEGLTTLLYIAASQKDDYQKAYDLPESRLAYLPPGMDPRCRRPGDAEAIRARKRLELGLTPEDIVLIEVGTNLWRKGVDRVMEALVTCRRQGRQVRFLLAGADKTEAVGKLAKRYGVEDSVVFLGPRGDVPELLLASDIMVHPAREEGTGTVLIEGLAAGLPVVCTEVCGFAPFVKEATGTTVAEPYAQEALNKMLMECLSRLAELKRKTMDYGSRQDFYSRSKVAVDFCERRVQHGPSDTCAETVCLHEGQDEWRFIAGYSLDMFKGILAAHLEQCERKQWLKNDVKRRVSRVEYEGVSYIVKEFCKDYRWKWFNHGLKTWRNSQLLRTLSAPCLALKRQNKTRSFLIFKDIGKYNLFRGNQVEHDCLEEMYEAAGNLMATMHQCGIYHADAKSPNFVINDLLPHISSKVLVVDCDDVRTYRRIPEALRIKNLAQFTALTGHLPSERRGICLKAFSDGYRKQMDASHEQMAEWLRQVEVEIQRNPKIENNIKS